MRQLRSAVLLTAMLPGYGTAWADDEALGTGDASSERNSIHPVVLIGLAEGMIAINAWLASEDPHAYGAAAALLFPLAGSSLEGRGRWIGLAGAEAIALFNLSADTDKKDKHDTFVDNEIAWHLLIGVVAASGALPGYKENSFSATLVPIEGGGKELRVSFRF